MISPVLEMMSQSQMMMSWPQVTMLVTPALQKWVPGTENLTPNRNWEWWPQCPLRSWNQQLKIPPQRVPNLPWRVDPATRCSWTLFKWRPLLPWKWEAQTFSLLDLAGAKVLGCGTWDLPDTWMRQTLVSNTQHQYSTARTSRVLICNSPWPKHGLLHHQIGSWCIENMNHYFSVGKVVPPMTTNGCSMFSRYLANKTVQGDGCPWVCLSIHWWSLVHHKGQSEWSPHEVEASTHQALMHRVEVNVPQKPSIFVMY